MQKKQVLITFSGLDGSGKSTQIANLRAALASWRKQTKLLAFWDDVVVLTRYREGFVHKVYKSEPGIGTPERPVQRRDKNVRRWYLTIARHFLYLLDAIHLRRVISRARHAAPDVIVMDRYIYDELANLPLSNAISRAFARAISALVPKPDVAFLLDVDPEAAVARKPEYPVDFMHQARQSYLQLSSLLGHMTVVLPQSINEARQQINHTIAPIVVMPAKRSAAGVESPHAA